jgi:hypothetical protein
VRVPRAQAAAAQGGYRPGRRKRLPRGVMRVRELRAPRAARVASERWAAGPCGVVRSSVAVCRLVRVKSSCCLLVRVKGSCLGAAVRREARWLCAAVLRVKLPVELNVLVSCAVVSIEA